VERNVWLQFLEVVDLLVLVASKLATYNIGLKICVLAIQIRLRTPI
jgi:hypothetical protein